ncbi:FtsX-like permease family protein [Streptococcus dentapri]|uniref:FtsX-like permease family protein n=1 Tax=Streptococcus dentapri TaxID=573564 RepID=A0ABV8D245_9STRE
MSTKKIYWKDVRKAITGSKGRFISIMLLMMLGSFALVGLKSTTPDMQRTASDYFDKYNTMDLTVMADHGLSKEDQKELSSIKNTTVEYGYQSDVTIKDSSDAVRIFSYDDDQKISRYELVKGKLPIKSNEIALSNNAYGNDYKIGDTITFNTGDTSTLKAKTYTITGFVNSSEILSKTSLGRSTAGDGSLSGYAVVTPKAFSSDVYSIARITYDDLDGLNPFKNDYKKKLAEHQKDLDDKLADNGAARLASLKADAQKDIDQVQKQVDTAKAQLAQLEGVGQGQLYQAQGSAVAAQISKAEKEITAAKKERDKLIEPNYTSYTRSTLPGGEGYTIFSNSIHGISVVANLFPIILYLVAAMVTFTTMTRFVDEERQNAGLLKALGYSSYDVIRKFVIYGFAAGIMGTILGVLAGTYYLPYRVGNITMSGLTLDKIELLAYPFYIVLAFILAIFSSVLPALWISYSELREKPAQLLLPKPPVLGSKIFLERLTFFWNRLSFTHKVTVRNIFRYKERMLMTIFGVAGSVALLFVGLGIQSSISGVADSQFGHILSYDMIVAQDTKASSVNKEAVTKAVDSKDFSNSQSVYYESTEQSIKGVTEDQAVTTLVTPGKDFSGMVNLSSPKGEKLKLSDKGVIISEKLAELYHVKAGDSFDYVDKDNHKIHLKVSAIAELYTGHFIFMTQNYYEKAFKTDFTTNAYLLKVKHSSNSKVKNLSTDLLALKGVTGVSQNISLITSLERVVHSLSGVMMILIVVSILMALVILYNLTTINVAERIRELSTIKVLGFHNKEVTMYIYRETITLSLIGILVGLASGFGLHRFLIKEMGGDNIIFDQTLAWYVYLIPILTIVLILAALGWLVNHRLKSVDMLEALKSVD